MQSPFSYQKKMILFNHCDLGCERALLSYYLPSTLNQVQNYIYTTEVSHSICKILNPFFSEFLK